MYFCFESNEIKSNDYKWIFHHLCSISDTIYFGYDNSLMINEKLFELDIKCEKIEVSERIKKRLGYNALGFKNNIFIKLFILDHENMLHLLGDRGYGAILFFTGQNEIASVAIGDFNYIYFKTEDKKLIEKLSGFEYLI